MKLLFFSKLKEARVAPKNSFSNNSHTFFFGSTTSGKTVNERTAMRTTAVYACVRILAETIASLPLHTYRYTDSGKEKATDHPLYYILHNEPNPEMTSFVFRETLMPDQMTVDRTAKGELYYIYTKEGQSYPLRADEVLHIPWKKIYI